MLVFSISCVNTKGMTPYYSNHTNDNKMTNLICIIKFGKFVSVIVRLKMTIEMNHLIILSFK